MNHKIQADTFLTKSNEGLWVLTHHFVDYGPSDPLPNGALASELVREWGKRARRTSGQKKAAAEFLQANVSEFIDDSMQQRHLRLDKRTRETLTVVSNRDKRTEMDELRWLIQKRHEDLIKQDRDANALLRSAFTLVDEVGEAAPEDFSVTVLQRKAWHAYHKVPNLDSVIPFSAFFQMIMDDLENKYGLTELVLTLPDKKNHPANQTTFVCTNDTCKLERPIRTVSDCSAEPCIRCASPVRLSYWTLGEK